MTIKISANANGTEGSLDIGATPVASLTQAGGIPFMRNILINGDMRINQRGVTIAAAAIGSYGPDRWKKVDASNMTQIVEEFNYRPSTQYVLSGTGVMPQVLTSPASGHWTIPNIPITATNIQLEEGSIATPFEQRPIGLELSLCQRYYTKFQMGIDFTSQYAAVPVSYPVTMRVAPGLNESGTPTTQQILAIYPNANVPSRPEGAVFQFENSAPPERAYYFNTWQASAEL